MHTLAAILVILFSIVGVALTLLTLPGTWLAVLVALLCKLWQPDLLSWWVIAAAGALALLAEIVEFAASAVGTAKAGGSKHGGIGSLIGGLAGAIFGAPFLFGLGAIPGAILGAFVGALLAERALAKRSWKDASRSGQGAAVGRFVATILKLAFAIAIALLLTIALAFNAFYPAATAKPAPKPEAAIHTFSESAKFLQNSSHPPTPLHSALPIIWPTLYAVGATGSGRSGPGIRFGILGREGAQAELVSSVSNTSTSHPFKRQQGQEAPGNQRPAPTGSTQPT